MVTVDGAKGYTERCTPTEASRRVLMATLGSTKAHRRPVRTRRSASTRLGGFVAWRYGAFMGVVAGDLGGAGRQSVGAGRGGGGASRRAAGRADLDRRALLVRRMLAVPGGSRWCWPWPWLAGSAAAGLPPGGSVLFAAGLGVGGHRVRRPLAARDQPAVRRAPPGRRLGRWPGGRRLSDAGVGRRLERRAWLVWLSPIGWAERLTPFGPASRVGLVPLVAATVVLTGVALWLCGAP